ncbi:MAG: glycosyltransferase family 2 protein [Polaromonas sp.]|jgi:hypothetical protein|nr:glycosyltransferase family 2 protein [Polaromonas sp.]
MKFSVLIPLYNKAAYIGETIRSVLAQTFTDFEVIVVDDGSTDGGGDVVRTFDDPRLKLVRKRNAGVAAARNFGISCATGEWVVFLDADDAHHPRFLEFLVMANQRYPKADTLATDFIRIPDSSTDWPPAWPELRSAPDIEHITDLPVRWMSGQTLCASSVAARTERLKGMQPCFPPGESCGEDLDLWFRLAEQAAIALVRLPLAAYRVDVEGSLTAQPRNLELAPFVHRMQSRALSGNMTDSQRKSALWMVAQHQLNLARHALALGRRVEGLRWLLRGRRAASGKRWWATAAMTFLFPGPLVKNWDDWRVRRATHPMSVPAQERK